METTCFEYHLPPIGNPITEYATLTSLFSVSRELAKKSNMKYVHIMFDVGAAIKAYHVIRNDSDLWNHTIIHIGDFHAMMAFSARSSGFEEIAYETGLCPPGSINALLSGKHYNKFWWVHEILSDALERLFIIQYLPEHEETLHKMGLLKNVTEIIECSSNDQEVAQTSCKNIKK